MIRPSRVLVLVATLAFALGLRLPEPVQYLPFAASLLLLGLPHGAVDHLVPARLSGQSPDARGVLGVGVLYLVLSGLCLALWFAAPAAAFALFVAVTVFHWGAADLHALVFFGLRAFSRLGRGSRVLLLLARGGIPMLVPLLAFPDVYRAVAADATGLFGAGFGAAFAPAFRVVVGLALAATVLASLLCAAWDLRRVRASLLTLVGETLLLVAFFAVVPPVFAVGLYFTLWHAPRHIARLVLLDGTSAAERRPGAALGRFARDAAPLTAVALGLLVALFFAVDVRSGDPGSLLALYLVLVSALTLPHAAVVTYMDGRQGLWARPSGWPSGGGFVRGDEG